MAVFLKGRVAESPFVIEVIEKDGEVRLRYNGHDFVRCHTVPNGQHVIDVIDVDTPNTFIRNNIATMCWRR